MNVLDHLRGEQPVMAAWRRDFHRHPEIGFQEFRTAGKVAELLRELGLKVRTGIGGTGVVGIIEGRRQGNRSVGLRAELDALPMGGRAHTDYESVRNDAFHGCGHDGHAATLLGAAKYLASNSDFAGTAYFIFQPAEETLRGGLAMMADGLFEIAPAEEIYALHNIPGLTAGHVGVRNGAILSGADHLRIDVHGVGTHAAQPHRGTDPILIACELVGLLQTIVSRSLDPLEAGVVTIGQIHGGTAANIIPETVLLEGTIRSMSESGRALLQRRIREICVGVAHSFGAPIDCVIDQGCPPTINQQAQADAVAAAARKIVGPGRVEENVTPVMASEDFAFMLQRRPGAYFFVGQNGPNCHHPEYVFDDDIMPIGAAIFVQLVRDRLGGNE